MNDYFADPKSVTREDVPTKVNRTPLERYDRTCRFSDPYEVKSTGDGIWKEADEAFKILAESENHDKLTEDFEASKKEAAERSKLRERHWGL